MELENEKEMLSTSKEELLLKIKFLEQTLEGVQADLWYWHLNTGKIEIPKAVKNFLGISGNILKVEEWVRAIHEDDRHVFEDLRLYVFDNYKNEFDIEHRLINSRDEVKWIELKGKIVKDNDYKPVLISAIYTDINKRKNAEAELIRSENKYRNLFENSLVGIFRTSVATGEILEANPKVWQMLGIPPKKGITAEDYYSNIADREVLLKKIKRQGFLQNEEIQFLNNEGRSCWVSISATLYEKEGYIETVIKDIDVDKRNHQELVRVNSELDHFVYHASHDLRSPLRSILGLINVLKIEENASARSECLEMIEGSVKRLDKLVVDLLSMSRNNRIDDPYVPINFMVEINNSITNFYHSEDNKKMEVITKVAQPVLFYSDITRVRMILNNLISNSFKYRNRYIDKSFVLIEIEVDNEFAKIKIQDNGEGIRKEDLPKIFDMFHRASLNSEGSGLGLYIVKNVVDKLKAKIRVESEYGSGTTFHLEVPNHQYKENES